MPYDYRYVAGNKSGEKWEVYNKDTGKVMGKHPTKKDALKQIAALAIHVKESILRLIFKRRHNES